MMALSRPLAFPEGVWPNDLATEQALLGTLISIPSVMGRLDALSPEHFYLPQNAAIFAACRALREAGTAIDAITLLAELPRHPQGNDVTEGYLAGCLSISMERGKAANVEHHAAVIRERAAERDLIRDLELAINEARDQQFGRAVSMVEAAVAQANRTALDATLPRPLSAFIDSAYEHMIAKPEDAGIIPTGISTLDAVLAGLHPGALVTLAAQTRIGKTALALSILYNTTILRAVPSAIWSLEMPEEQLTQRLIYIDAQISSQAALKRQLDDDMKRRAASSRDRIRSAPLYMKAMPGMDIGKLAGQVREMVNRHKIRLCVVDHLSIMAGGEARRDRNRVQEVSAITAGLKGIALRHNIPVLALCQVNRKPEERNHRVTLADLKDSSSIEQDSDVVLFIDRPGAHLAEEGKEPTEENEWAYAVIAKHRSGEQGRVPLKFHGKYMHYTSPDWQGF